MCEKKNKSSDRVPPPLPPPPPYQWYHASKKEQEPPYNFASMQTGPYGVNATHIPMSTSTGPKPGTFQVWGITGYTGNIETSGNLSPTETACRLAMIKQATHGYNHFNISDFQSTTSTSDQPDDPPRPPTPTPATQGMDDGDDNGRYSQYFPASPKAGSILGHTISPPPPPPSSNGGSLNCMKCGGEYRQPVKKIKKEHYNPLCWACVWFHYMAGAQRVWDES